MPRCARTLFGLKNVDAVDIDDPVSFGTRWRTENQSFGISEEDGFLSSRRNGCRIESREVVAESTAAKQPRVRTPRTTLLTNDFHGLRWIDGKRNEYQTLNVSGKGVRGRTDVYHSCDIEYPEGGLILPDISVVKPYLVAGRTGFSKRQRRRRKKKDSFELIRQEKDGFLKEKTCNEKGRVEKVQEDDGYLKPWDGREKIKKDREDCGVLKMKPLDEWERIRKDVDGCGSSKLKPLDERGRIRKDVDDCGSSKPKQLDERDFKKDPKKKIFINVILPKIT